MNRITLITSEGDLLFYTIGLRMPIDSQKGDKTEWHIEANNSSNYSCHIFTFIQVLLTC